MAPLPRCVSLCFLLLTACAFTISCSDDPDDTIVLPQLGAEAPKLPIPVLRLEPEFASNDSIVRYARGFVMGQLNRLRPISQEAATSMPILNSTGWGEAGGACRYRQFGEPGGGRCSYRILVCSEDGGYTWSQILDGPCGLDTEGPRSYDNWTRFRGFTTEDATQGEFTLFLSGTGIPGEAWSWRSNPERTVTDWSFYRGAPSPQSLIATLRVDDRALGRWRGELVWSADSKWDADFAEDGTSGRMTALSFNRRLNQWVPQQEIDWTPAHGSWKYFDSSGTLLETRSW